MKKGLIITLPAYDDVTEYFSVFSKPIVEEAKERNIPVKKIEKKDVNRKRVESTIVSLNYGLNIFNGHGNANVIAGHKHEPLIEAGINAHLLYDKITYARACWAGLGVGDEIKKACKGGCFIGYTLPFTFLADPTRISNPHKDKVASICLDPSNTIPLELLRGSDAKYASEKSKNEMLKNMAKIISNGDSDMDEVYEALWTNYECQVVLGNEEAKLY